MSKNRTAIRVAVAAVLAAANIAGWQAMPNAYAYVGQSPTTLATPPDVNIMFTLDDSGSMFSDGVPDTIAATGIWTPDASKILDNRDITTTTKNFSGTCIGVAPDTCNYTKSRLISFQSTDSIWRYWRSAAGNPLYYNPAIRYDAWPSPANDQIRGTGGLAAQWSTGNVRIINSTDDTPMQVDGSGNYNRSEALDIRARVTVTGLATDPDDQTKNYWPATYYIYTGPSTMKYGLINDANNVATNFTKVEIKSSVSTYGVIPSGLAGAGTRWPNRSDCAGTTSCTYNEEMQNFANWLQFYRLRVLMAKGAVASAFSKQGTNLRVGLAALNQGSTSVDGTNTDKVVLGVRKFNGTARSNFYTTMYSIGTTNSTPSREEFGWIAKYFARTGAGSPYNENVADWNIAATPVVEYACRRNYHMFSTDGFWNGGAAGSVTIGSTTTDLNAVNADDWASSTVPPSATAPNPIYTISGGAFTANPYKDSYSGNLADPAAFMWKTDMRPDLPNVVRPSSRDPAYWQHVTTFAVGLGIAGTLDYTLYSRTGAVSTGAQQVDATLPTYRYPQSNLDYAVANKVAIPWPSVTADNATTGDDLIHAAVNGHGRYFVATDPARFASDLASALQEATDQQLEASGVAATSATYQFGGTVYQPIFDPAGWAGRLNAFTQNTSGVIAVNPAAPLWEASAKLPAFGSRKIMTIDPVQGAGSRGKEFVWSDLTTAQQLALNNDSNVLSYLRGDTSRESRNGGFFRDRPTTAIVANTATASTATLPQGTLGDIINSAPTLTLDAGGQYDRLLSSLPGAGAPYITYHTGAGSSGSAVASTVFVGANDGMFHAFDSSSGVERFAFVPGSVYNVTNAETDGTAKKKLAWLTEPAYTHRYTVDGTPALGDAYINAGWNTVVVSSTGAGSRAIFALQVTDPTVPTVTTWKSSNILWEFSDSVLSGDIDMGYVIGRAQIGVMKDGTWVAIFGNGYSSAAGNAVLYIVNLQTGALVKKITVTGGANNGLATPEIVVDSNRQIITAYAGDLNGNLWKFDLSGATSTTWVSAYGTSPLVKVMNDSGNPQPIVAKPAVVFTAAVSGPIIVFGTGKYFETEDTQNTTASLRVQSLYGVWDNGTAVTAATAGALRTSSTALLTRQGRVTSTATSGFGTSSANTFTYSATMRGWFFDLVPATGIAPSKPNNDLSSIVLPLAAGTGERSYLDPVKAGTLVLFALNVPSTDLCAAGGVGSVLALDPVYGLAPNFAVFDVNGDGAVNSADMFTPAAAGSAAQAVNEVKRNTIIASPLVQTSSSNSTALNFGQTSTGGGVEAGTLGGCSGSASGRTTISGTDTSQSSVATNFCGVSGRVTWRQIQ